MTTTTWRPRFGRFHRGPWPHDCSEGVGLAMSGAPNDPAAFVSLMQGYSCNPPAARRILDELRAGLTKRTTVMAGLDFATLGEELAALGVTLVIIEPAQAADQRLDAAVFDRVRGRALDESDLTEAQRAEIGRREALMRESLATLPVDFGPYA